jgi:hypothetical protein
MVRDPRIPASLPEDWRGLLGAMTARDPRIRPTALEVAVMARELASQLDGWVMPEELATPSGPGWGGPTVAMTPSALPLVAPALPLRPRRRAGAGGGRRRAADAVLLASGATAIVALGLSLGTFLAPASSEPKTEPTQRPTPTVTAPPQTVEPADATQPSQHVEPPASPQIQPQPAPANGGHSNKGPGNNSGKGAGKDKG